MASSSHRDQNTARTESPSMAFPINTNIPHCPSRSLTSPHDGATPAILHGPVQNRDVHPSGRCSRRGSVSMADGGHRYHTQPSTPREDNGAPALQYFEPTARGPMYSEQRIHGQDPRGPRFKLAKTLEQDRGLVGDVKRGAKDWHTNFQNAIKRNWATDRNEPGAQWANQTPSYHQLDKGQHRYRVDQARDSYFQLAQKSEELISCQAKLKDCQADNRDLQAALHKTQERVGQMEDLVDQMQSTLDNKESFLGKQSNDEDLQRRFNTLMFEIKTWSKHFNDGTVGSFNENNLSEYQRVFPRCVDLRHLDKVAGDKKRKRLFMRGWTAYIMCTRLFRDLDSDPACDLGGDVWLDKALADKFREMEDRFWLTDHKVIPHKTFNDWRALTAELLHKVADNNSEELNSQVQTTITTALSEVMELAKAWPVAGTDLKAEEDKLRGTFVRAVQFARDIRHQRALWSIRFPTTPETGSLKFDPATMQDVRDDEDDDEVDLEELRKFQVEIVVTPTLYKRGTMNGEWFDREEAVGDCLAKVVISAPR